MSQFDEIVNIVAQKAQIDRSKLTREASLVDLQVSSLDMVDVIFTLEDKYGVELPFNANTNAGDFKTLGDLIDMVEKQLATTQAKAAT
ncbi:MAG TPA: acyl carrier protein [Roseiarcus sp.]|nr:acyl carrier protein [Roseiarcus sp.]